MGWYETKKEILDYDLPIVAVNDSDTEQFLLCPQINVGEYKIIGYNWLCMQTGKYTTSVCFPTPEKAIESWSEYEMYNVKVVRL